MTCPTRDGAAAFIKEGECVWARLSGREFDQDKTAQTLGFDENSFEVAGGLQGSSARCGGSAWPSATSTARSIPTTIASSDVDRFHGGAVLKYNPGPLLLAGAVSGGFGWYDTERTMSFPGFSAHAQADNEIGYVDGRFRAEYLLSNGQWYAKPMVDLDATHIDLDGAQENGAGGVGLNVAATTRRCSRPRRCSSSAPSSAIPGYAGQALYPRRRHLVRRSRLCAAGELRGRAIRRGPVPHRRLDRRCGRRCRRGVDVIGAEGASFRLYYDGRFGDTVEEHAGGIKASWNF